MKLSKLFNIAEINGWRKSSMIEAHKKSISIITLKKPFVKSGFLAKFFNKFKKEGTYSLIIYCKLKDKLNIEIVDEMILNRVTLMRYSPNILTQYEIGADEQKVRRVLVNPEDFLV